MQSMADLLGKRVHIYPGDSAVKIGIIQVVSDAGILFKITASESNHFTAGALHFISFSANLSFEVMED